MVKLKKKIQIPNIHDISIDEQKLLEKLIKDHRKKYIRTSDEIIDDVLKNAPCFLADIRNKKVSESIAKLREAAWESYLTDEVNFNIQLIQSLYDHLDTPRSILDSIVNNEITQLSKDQLLSEVKNICGEYAGRIFPYIYKISLSTTNSRRSRAGKTFESIIYHVYTILNYEFDAQNKVGRKTFADLGLGKKVDSILPNIQCYKERRNKTIIGTMKTSLRERWQEVAEEIERTKVPEIHLLTVDENISISKAKEMANHNIIVVTYDWIANSEKLSTMKNIISFEEYLFEEIPAIINFWK